MNNNTNTNTQKNTPSNQQKTSSEVNKERTPSSCPINTTDKAIQAVEKYTNVYASKDISYTVEQRKKSTYNVFASSKELKENGGSGTVGNYLVDACSGAVWNVADLIPDEMVGTWSNGASGTKKIEYTLTNETIKTGGKIFVVDVCDPNTSDSNTTYTISWRLDDFKEQYGYTPDGPQPFILTYNAQADTISLPDNTILNRVSK